ncbi:tetratricopeptide repeat protein [Pedobacter caeni]|uniref:Tetratricopeptide repeat-containing protein n=1 Tax=Pedobacter caeni TaxID=288992 RepID=A0A1M4YUR8_9SPHI|nr:tetratricopeptide repeat protein [Pedobacter caeni]SHF09513.1 Tetratricopeptide repeat-containing protein [Pedobacter caeni]
MGLFDFLKARKKAIAEDLFNSKQYQIEITALAQTFYFENKQDLSVVKKKLLCEGLDEKQSNIIIERMKEATAEMVEDFQTELTSGKILKVDIIPNPEHQKGKVDKEQVDRYIGYAAYQIEQKNFDNALELLDKAIELDDQAVLAYANKGAIYDELQDHEKALYFHEKALEIEPDNILILENRMDTRFAMLSATNEEDFIDSVKACLRVNTMNPNALIYITQYYLKTNNIDNALISIKNLFSEFYQENIAIKLLLNTFGSLSKEKALDQFDKFENELPRKATYQLNYCKGLYLKDLGDFDAAIQTFKKLNALQEFSWNYYQIGIIKNLQNETDESITYLKLTFDLEPALKQDAKQYFELENLWTNPKFVEITK